MIHNPGIETKIREQPDDNNVRLVYCDWLDENNGGNERIRNFLRYSPRAMKAIEIWAENWKEDKACQVPLLEVIEMFIAFTSAVATAGVFKNADQNPTS